MARTFIKPRINQLYRDAVEGLVGDLSKKSTFAVILEADQGFCGNCIWDPVHKTSTGRYNHSGPKPFDGAVCPVCKGAGKIIVSKTVVVPAIVQWGRVNRTDFSMPTPAGILPQGYARIKVKVRYHDTILAAKGYVVDKVRCSKVGEPIKRGLQTYVITELVVRRDD